MIGRTFYASTFVVADGITTTWPFSFAGVNTGQSSGTTPYIYPADVKVQELYTDIDGVKQVTQRDGVLAAPNQLTIIGPPVIAGREIRIYRETEARFPLVDYRDLQSVSEHDLDLANRQAVFIAQETRDAASANILQDAIGNYDANGRRIVNLAPGIDDNDAVTMRQHRRAVRSGFDDMSGLLPAAADRAGKLLSFDATGQPQVAFPPAGSATELEMALADPTRAGRKVSWELSKLTKQIMTVQDGLDSMVLSIWSFAKYAVGYAAGGDPATWDWGPAVAAADRVLDTMTLNGGTLHVKAGTYGLGSECKLVGLGKCLRGDGMRSTELRALPGYTGNLVVMSESSYSTVSDLKVVGVNGSTQRAVSFPRRVLTGIVQQCRIMSVQAEAVHTGFYLENPVHCTVMDVRTDRRCTGYGLHSQFIAQPGVGQGGTNLRLIGGWFQAHEITGTACYINSNTGFSSHGTQYEHGRYGLVMRAVPGATITGALFEDCGMAFSFQGCTNVSLIGPSIDSGTTQDMEVAVQPIADIDGGSGIRIAGLLSFADNKNYIDYLIRFTNASYGVYPRDVLIDGYSSEGNKGLLGSANVTDLRIIQGGVHQMNGARMTNVRIQNPVLTKAPTAPAVGELFTADGTLWNPIPGTTPGRCIVVYAGSGVYKLVLSF